MIEVHEVEIARITYDDSKRIRQELDPAGISELASSIKDVGQINPIVINRDYSLVAGRRRIAACTLLNMDRIQAQFKDELPLITQKVIEFDENHKRKQLTWQEEASAISEIHTLKKEEDTDWNAKKTAEVLGVSEGKVSEDLQLADNLPNERVSGRPSRRGALQTVKRERELAIVRELARRKSNAIGLKVSERSTQFGQGIVYEDNCLPILKDMEEASVDLIITDPPWGIDFDTSSQWTHKWLATYDDAQNQTRELLYEVFPQLYRVLKPTNHIYCFFPIQEVQWWVTHMCESGFLVRIRPLVWFKTGQPSISDVYASFLPAYEVLLWGWKPGEGNVRRYFGRPTPEGFGYPRQPGIWHENEKPVELLERFIEASSSVNETVLDPFAGGGSTLAAAFGLGRYFIGIESDPGNYSKIIKRIREIEDARIPSEDDEEEC